MKIVFGYVVGCEWAGNVFWLVILGYCGFIL